MGTNHLTGPYIDTANLNWGVSITVLVVDMGKWCHKIRGDIVCDVL